MGAVVLSFRPRGDDRAPEHCELVPKHAPPASLAKLAKARLSSVDVERVAGPLAMWILRCGLAEQARFGRPMAHGGGVYFTTETWARQSRRTPKQVEHAIAALRRFGLVSAGTWCERVRRGRKIRAFVREFLPGHEVVADGRRLVVPCSPEAVALALADLDAHSRWGGARSNAGGSRPGAGRPKNQQVRGRYSASSGEPPRRTSKASRAEKVVKPPPVAPLRIQHARCPKENTNERDLQSPPKEGTRCARFGLSEISAEKHRDPKRLDPATTPTSAATEEPPGSIGAAFMRRHRLALDSRKLTVAGASSATSEAHPRRAVGADPEARRWAPASS